MVLKAGTFNEVILSFSLNKPFIPVTSRMITIKLTVNYNTHNDVMGKATCVHNFLSKLPNCFLLSLHLKISVWDL